MKRPVPRSRFFKSFGFTLIELLVVMGIIAILAGVLFPVATGAINSAKRAKANATINQIQTAVLAYNTEYGAYPVPVNASGKDFLITDGANHGTDSADATDWTYLLYALCGNINPYNTSTTAPTATASGTISNTRSIAFLSLKSSDVFTSGTAGPPKNPLPASSTVSTTSCSYFNIAMDGDYDGLIPTTTGSNSVSWTQAMPNFATAASGSITLTGGTSTAGVALWVNCTGTVSTATSTVNNPNNWEKTY